jgi:hypothetical protein
LETVPAVNREMGEGGSFIVARHINFWLMAAQNLRRNKGKSLAIVIPLILVMDTISFMLFTGGGFAKDAEIAERFLPDITVQGIEAGRVGNLPGDKGKSWILIT